MNRKKITLKVLDMFTDFLYFIGEIKVIIISRKLSMKFDEYKVIYVTEGGCGTIFLGSSGLPLKRLESTLNQEANDGWQLVFQVIEQKRFWLFWSREAVILTLGRSNS